MTPSSSPGGVAAGVTHPSKPPRGRRTNLPHPMSNSLTLKGGNLDPTALDHQPVEDQEADTSVANLEWDRTVSQLSWRLPRRTTAMVTMGVTILDTTTAPDTTATTV